MSKTDNEEIDVTLAKMAGDALLNAQTYKAERDRAVALLREAGDEEWGSVDWYTGARAFLAEVDNG